MSPQTLNDFISAFFGLLTRPTFRGQDFLSYLRLPTKRRSNDEASVVDMAVVGPLLGLLGFDPAERVYNQQDKDSRPDFAPRDELFGTCFLVEDKNTASDLTLDMGDPGSHLAQLAGYARTRGVRLGLLTNGRRLMLWRFDDPTNPRQLEDLDVVTALEAWTGDPAVLPAAFTRPLQTLFDQYRKASFTDPHQLEAALAVDLEAWQRQALPLGDGQGNEHQLVETVRVLLGELQRDARRTLEHHLTRCDEHNDRAARLSDTDDQLAEPQINALRERVLEDLRNSNPVIGLNESDLEAISTKLQRLEQDPRAYTSQRDLLDDLLVVINAARLRKYANRPRAAQPWRNLEELPNLNDRLLAYSERALALHQRRATLRQTYRADLSVREDYDVWVSLVQETMLGGQDERQRRDEFALQAAYVVFIRLLLIRVCEDKGIFPHRFLSDGGIQHWQEDIRRYLVFAQGNPYDPLLDMAYTNAQNIYAHFFTGRELFNWYRLDQQRFILTLYQLSRFNFAGVDSDIVGTIYSTYVGRKEKREKGQYYTPPQIVAYILDQVGYTAQGGITLPNKRLIDPACGSGTFLVTAARRLLDAYQRVADDPVNLLERVRNGLYGFDLNPFACYLAEVNLLIQVLDLVKLAHDRGQRPRLQRFHIYNVDSLTKPSGMYSYARFNTLLAEESDQVDQIKRRQPGSIHAGGFAYVVANPPYGARLSDAYKEQLRQDWSDVFYGKPDTYVFFLRFGLDLLAANGVLGYITPNTYLMGTNTVILRRKLLGTGRITEIVDLPQGIWEGVNVDCVLLFLHAESNEVARRNQQVQINLLNLHDSLQRLTERVWSGTLQQPQAHWIDHERNEINIRYDDLLQRIEDACRVAVNGIQKVLRLGDVTESTQGIIPYETEAQSKVNLYIKNQRDVPPHEPEWRKLLDSSAFIGRYELRWGSAKPFLKYGNWLCRPREEHFFANPKLLFIRLRNRNLKRRLIAQYDDQHFYNRHNFSNIIAQNNLYDIKYILALFNSSLLNYWYMQQFPDVEISIIDTRQLPIYPADAETQAQIVTLVDQLLEVHRQLNTRREQGYRIAMRRDGSREIAVPYDELLSELQVTRPDLTVDTLFGALARGQIEIPEGSDPSAPISGNVFIPARYPENVVLRHSRFWLRVPNERLRRFLVGYLGRPRWRGQLWRDIQNTALHPADEATLEAFFQREQERIAEISDLLDQAEQLDNAIDDRVLDLYGIIDPAERQRVRGSAPLGEDEPPAEEQPTLGDE